MNVSQVMSRDVVTCRPEDNLSQAARAMWDHDIGCLPVLGWDGRVIGMITDRDIAMAAYTQGRTLVDLAVEIAMAREVFTCLETDSLIQAEEVMRAHRVRRLPVLDGNGHLQGILSLNDLALEAAREQGKRGREVSAQEVSATMAAVCEHRRPTLLSIAA